MEKIFFIKLDDRDLFIDQVLVEFDGAPIFFVCKDQRGNFYSSICSDYDNEEYILSSTTPRKIAGMLRGKDTIRDFFVSGAQFWELIFKNGKIVDKAKKISVDEIDSDVLPIEGEYFILANSMLKEYANMMESIIYSGSVWLRMGGLSGKVAPGYALESNVSAHMPISVNYKSIFKGMCQVYAESRIEISFFSDLTTPYFWVDFTALNNEKVENDMNALVVKAA